MSANGQRYDVGGVLLERPFKIRRLGHFGFNIQKLEEAREFYGDLLGFTVSDKADFSRAPWFPKDKGLGDSHGYFMRYGSDHHAMVLFSKPVMDVRADRKFAPEVTINQITWQCGSLREIGEAHSYFEEQQVAIQRVGRDMPGSNWHVYVYDPDGHTNELYYGIEQVGWNQRSKPRDMYYRGFREKPELPQMSEAAEIVEAQAKGIDIFSGHRRDAPKGETYDVEGVLLARPFKITKIGPVSLFVDELGSYAQLRAAVEFLKGRGCTLIDTIPPELYPGIDYSAFALDPDGHCIQLYYYMEQIGWDGRVRPAAERRRVNGGQWPERLEPLSDTYVDQVFQGPLG